ncbi:hypothetical protein BDW42DRAFT_179149 [Aspergillus taichungensis]|uniref:Tat pathway signal sequence n=1 Tax=Aspergillus taichungensis TaxID=482145 RepID=A0A2J5HH49_9EURO|nr:hypothetical protein BDW42DRAFT_179149 [Aspergillus taichungensis]
MSPRKYGLNGNSVDSEDSSKPFLKDRERFYDILRHEIARRKRLQYLVIFPWTILAASIPFILVGAGLLVQDAKNIRIPTTIYSPAQHVIKYGPVTFNGGFDKSNKTPYQGYPNEANNQAWEALYNFGVIEVPRSEAAKLVNTTMPVPEDPTQYVVELDVFHELHCLNHLRKMAWGVDMGVDTSNETEVDAFHEHMDHCIDSLRQSLMCSADVSTIHWLWDDDDKIYKADPRTIHMCRNFDAIRDWAFARRARPNDRTTYVSDPLQNGKTRW